MVHERGMAFEGENAEDVRPCGDNHAPPPKLSGSRGINNKSTSWGEDKYCHLSLRPHCTPCGQFPFYTNTETHSLNTGSEFGEEMTQELIN